MPLIDHPLDHASNRHKLLYEIFTTSPSFKHMIIKQEIPVRTLVPGYPTGRHKVDWYIQDLRVAIEIMGEQHEKPVTFGGIDKSLARVRLGNTRRRDEMKRSALLEEGYSYVEIWYNEDLSEDSVIDKITQACEDRELADSTGELNTATKEAIKRSVNRKRGQLRTDRRRDS